MKKTFTSVFGFTALVAGVAMTTSIMPAQAGTLTFDLDRNFSSAVTPEGPPPWLSATFVDSATNSSLLSNQVLLTLSSSGLVEEEIVTEWGFNFTGAANRLSFARQSGSQATENGLLFSNSLDGGGRYDFVFDFPPPAVPNGSGLPSFFSAGETVSYIITYNPLTGSSAIDVSFFEKLSTPPAGNGRYYTAAHVQRIDPSNGQSVFIGDDDLPDPDVDPPGQPGVGVPEPSALTGLVAIAGIGSLLRRRKSS